MKGLSRRNQLAASLKGQQIHIPDLRSLFPGWAAGMNESRETLTKALDDWLRGLPLNDMKRAKFMSTDFALSAAVWYPHTGFEELRTILFFVVWLFIWDDDVDEPTGVVTDDFDKAQIHRQEAVLFIQQALGLAGQQQIVMVSSPLIKSFQAIGDYLCTAYSSDQRKVFFEELVLYMHATEKEQMVRLSGEYLPVQEYWALRMDSSACGVTNALIELSNHVRTPKSIMRDPEVKMLCDQNSIIIWLSNDLLSLQKEQAQGCIDSYVPLAYAETGCKDLQQVVDDAIKLLQAEVKRFEAIAQSLLSRTNSTSAEAGRICDFVQACRENCTGNLSWTLETTRYGLRDAIQEGGSLRLIL